ncbi:unnamed protein product [Schistocephalus solidus]|uniref:Protein FAM166B n=1 Tax=Schistocephalus solidus TaxID=70667 RepID=A0A183SZ81_SCHSO|nr:unnamed protein product [Schistocephalus solidus]
MTAIEYGGGPTAEQRRDFCNLPQGAHIPGYMGYCPQFKFVHGLTYGIQTAKIAATFVFSKKLPYYKGPTTASEIYLTPRIGDDKISKTPKVFKDEIPRDKIPKATGENKYMDTMIPGYTGDVPHMPYKFGGTFKHLCEECVDEFVSEYQKREKDTQTLKELSGLFPKLKPIRDDPSARDNMNLWIDDYLKKSAGRIGPRGPTEPPIPGYTGYIPQLRTTELGTANRFHVGAERSLEVFRMKTKNHYDRLSYPSEPLKPKPERIGPPPSSFNEEPHSLRTFRNEGVIPTYKGHVHQMRFSSGRTIGDASRKLEVCSHNFPSYGLFTKNRDLVEADQSNGS